MPVMRPFHPVAAAAVGRPPAGEADIRAGSVKIIDMFALDAGPAIQSWRAQILECTVEFWINRGVNELDMGEGDSAGSTRTSASEQCAASRSGARVRGGGFDAATAG